MAMNLNSILLFLAVICTSLIANALEHPGGMHPKAQIAFVKAQIQSQSQPYYDAYRQLIAYADSALAHPSHALADFSVPGYYVNAEMHRKNSKSLNSDSFDAYACALAYQLSGQTKYADKSRSILKSWAELNTQYSEADGSLVMAYAGSGMVMAGELLMSYKGWKDEEQLLFKKWVKGVYLKACNEIRNRKNNWADWGRFGSILSAYFLDDSAEIAENIRLIKSDLFHKIAPDGSMPEETRRGANGIWYTYFSLAPITAACWVAYNATGENLFFLSQDNRSLKNALDYLYYYNLNPKEWKWFENPRPGSPENWPGLLLASMADIYQDSRYTAYVTAVQPIINTTHHFAWVFPTLMKVQLNEYK